MAKKKATSGKAKKAVKGGAKEVKLDDLTVKARQMKLRGGPKSGGSIVGAASNMMNGASG